jgi:hypothetical protein
VQGKSALAQAEITKLESKLDNTHGQSALRAAAALVSAKRNMAKR